MKNDELIRKLNSVGKAAFVENFSLFKSYADGLISRTKCIDSLVASAVSNMDGAAIRTSNAELIFRAGAARDALEIISKSGRVPADVVSAARALLKNSVG